MSSALVFVSNELRQSVWIVLAWLAQLAKVCYLRLKRETSVDTWEALATTVQLANVKLSTQVAIS